MPTCERSESCRDINIGLEVEFNCVTEKKNMKFLVPLLCI